MMIPGANTSHEPPQKGRSGQIVCSALLTLHPCDVNKATFAIVYSLSLLFHSDRLHKCTSETASLAVTLRKVRK